MIKAEFKIDKRFKQKLAGRYERFNVEAGVLRDSPHRVPRPASQGLGTLQGGPVRKMKMKTSGNVSEVAEAVRKRHGVDYLREPFDQPKSKAMIEFRKAFAELLTGKAKSYARVERALRAVIRTPIIMKKYGPNSALSKAVKTFNRKLIDTGQFFKAITAKVRSNRRVQK